MELSSKDAVRQQKCNSKAGVPGAVCLASSRIYVQNLIQFGNLALQYARSRGHH
jgi:hypothetical protein